MKVLCVDISGLDGELTIGKEYEVTKKDRFRGDEFYHITDNNNCKNSFYTSRFKEVNDYKVDLL